MTRLSKRKTKLMFVTESTVWYKGKFREIVVEVDNGFCGSVRLTGTRQRYAFSWEGLFVHSADRFARAERDRKKAERLGKRRRTEFITSTSSWRVKP